MVLRGVGPRHVARHGRISRNNLWLIQHGRIAKPFPETLRKLARGIAAGADGQVDIAVMRDVYRDLAVAAGYDDPLDVGPYETLEAALGAVLDDTTALLFAETVRAYYGRYTKEQRTRIAYALAHELGHLARRRAQPDGEPDGEPDLTPSS